MQIAMQSTKKCCAASAHNAYLNQRPVSVTLLEQELKSKQILFTVLQNRNRGNPNVLPQRSRTGTRTVINGITKLLTDTV